LILLVTFSSEFKTREKKPLRTWIQEIISF